MMADDEIILGLTQGEIISIIIVALAAFCSCSC